MRRSQPWPLLFALLFAAGAEEASAFALRSHVLANGGSRTVGSARSITGTAGQAAIGVCSGSGHRLHHGFWSAAAITGVGIAMSMDSGVASPRLGMPAPNPTSGQVMFSLSLPATSGVQLIIYDVTGRACRTVVSGVLAAGTHMLRLDTASMSDDFEGSGVYYARLVVDGRSRAVRSFIILR